MELPIPEVVFTWQFWVTAVICYIVCEAIKRIPNLPDYFINIINLVVGSLVYVAFVGGWIDVSAYLFGILAASAADLAYQLYKNIFNSMTTPRLTEEHKVGGSDD